MVVVVVAACSHTHQWCGNDQRRPLTVCLVHCQNVRSSPVGARLYSPRVHVVVGLVVMETMLL